MTEADWLSCPDPATMLVFVADKISERKLRLFACSCCRSAQHGLGDPLLWSAVEVAERHADGFADDRQLEAVRNAICPAPYFTGGIAAAAAYGAVFGGKLPPVWAIEAAADLICTQAVGHALDRGRGHISRDTKRIVRQSQAEILRCIAGPLPFRPVTTSPSWLKPEVVTLAQAIYDEPDFDRLPILEDALKYAGCDNPDFLGHCRSQAMHVRGCWVVDAILGRS